MWIKFGWKFDLNCARLSTDMCTIKVAWRPPATSQSLFLPPSCQNFPPSTRHTSFSPTASGTLLLSTLLLQRVSPVFYYLCYFQNRDVEQCLTWSYLSARQPLLENHHLRRQRGGSSRARSGRYAARITWPPVELRCDWLRSVTKVVSVCLCRRVSGHDAREGPRVRQLHHVLHPFRVHGGSLHLPQTG